MAGNNVAVIGAGPYGLAAAAHLRAAAIDITVFGRALEFWKNNMPRGMLLRSSWDASHIADPGRRLTLNHYYELNSIEPVGPVSLQRFVEYGSWFQRQVAPDLDHRQVVGIEREDSGFRLMLEDGEAFSARRVVIATGIGPFAHRPAAFERIPRELASHSVDQKDFRRFAGKDVVVIGGGQSAIESAVLLSESGARVEAILRSEGIRWLHRREIMRHRLNPLAELLFPKTDVGPPVLNQIIARPDWFRRFPSSLQARIAYRCIRPAASAWLKPRAGNVHVTSGRTVVSASVAGGQVVLKLDDGSERRADHVLMATGYRVDIRRYPFLAGLVESIQGSNGYPDLAAGFESSIPGLHFLGAPSAKSFGPLMRFVAGTAYAANALTRCVLGSATTPAIQGEVYDSFPFCKGRVEQGRARARW